MLLVRAGRSVASPGMVFLLGAQRPRQSERFIEKNCLNLACGLMDAVSLLFAEMHPLFSGHKHGIMSYTASFGFLVEAPGYSFENCVS